MGPVDKRLCKFDRMKPEQPTIGSPLQNMEEIGCIYMDYNATTPIFPEVAAAMMPFLSHHFGNPSSGHVYGRQCRSAVDAARLNVATLINAAPEEICFTGCGTESDNWAIYGAVMMARTQNLGTATPHVVTTAIEHPAVLAFLEHLKIQGLLEYSAVPVNSSGLVDLAAVQAAFTADTVLVTVMHSNNEVGAIQPIAEISKLARAHGALMHSDAAQSIGKVGVDVEALGVDLLTIVGHKFGAPKGIAALFIRKGVTISNFLHGGGQEGGRRAGTENVLLAVGLGAAAALAAQEALQLRQHMAAMRDALQRGLEEAFAEADLRVNGPCDDDLRLPNTLSISVRGLDASALLAALSSRLAASAGSACHSHDGPTVSGVLKAMQVPLEFAVGTLRLSTGRHTMPEDVAATIQLITEQAHAQGVAVRSKAPGTAVCNSA